jgi:COG3958: transketolase, C-terminal subunit
MGVHESRTLYLSHIIEEIKKGEDIYIVSADLAAPCMDEFRENYPYRYISVGIAEQNLIAVASGLALSGKKVIAYAANPFTITRAFDQIRNCVSMMNLPVVIAGLGAGFSVTECGATHFVLEDINILRGCGHIRSINISDMNLTERMVKETLCAKRPYYIRFDKLVTERYPLTDVDFVKGYRFLQKENSDICMVSTGIMATECLELVRSFHKAISVIDVFAFPFDSTVLVAELKNYQQLVVVEELTLQGGLGSSVLEALADEGHTVSIKRFGVDMSAGYPARYGSREWHLKNQKMDKDSIIDFLRSLQR